MIPRRHGWDTVARDELVLFQVGTLSCSFKGGYLVVHQMS